jgi:hypothetical protein
MAKNQSKQLVDDAKDLTRLFQSQTDSVKKLHTLFQGLSDGPISSFSRQVELAGENFDSIVDLNRDLNKELIQITQTEVGIKKLMSEGLSAKSAELVYSKKLAEANANKLGLSKEELKTFTDQYDKAIKYQKQLDHALEAKEKEAELAEKIKELEELRNESLKEIGVNTNIIKDIMNGGIVRTIALTGLAKKLGDAFSEAYKELKTEGLSATQAAHESMTSFTDSMSTGFLTSAKSIREARKAISDMGGTLHEAEEAGKDVANLVSVYGGSEAAAGKMYGTMTKVAGMNKEAALRAVEFGSALSVAAGVPADTVTKAVAENTDAAALAGPKYAKSFALAAVNAKKLGVEMSSVASMQKSLLDFESSVNNQMEASVLLGREINLDKAREFALSGDLAGMQSEILKNVGSAAEFDKMSVLQKEALAKSMGVSVGDMAKMVHGQGELTELGKEAAEAEKAKAGTMDRIKNAAMENMGAILGAVPGLVMQTAQMVAQFSMMKSMRAMSGAPAKGGIIGKLTGGMFGKTMEAPAPPKIPSTDNLSKAGKGMSGGGMMAGFKKNMKALAGGFKEMGQPGVLKGVGNTFLAGPALIVATLAIPFLLFMGKVELKKLDKNFTALATGLTAMSTTMVGSLALGVFGIAAIPALISIPFLLFMGKMDLKKIQPNFMALAVGLNAMSSTFVGSAALLLFAIAGALAIPSLLFLGGIALIGAAAATGLTALGVGLAAFGNPATALFVLIGIGLIAALGAAMIPFAYAISLLTPVLKVLGDIIIGVFSAIPPIITAIADGFVRMFGAISQDMGSFLLLGPALMMTGMGLMSMAAGGFMALPIIGALIALATVAPALIGLGAALGGIFGGGGGEKEDKMDTLITKIDVLIGVASKGGTVNMDGKKVGEIVRLGINSSGVR